MVTTLNDIAEMVGVSPNTVSRALREKSDISEATRERVCKAASALGYRPNAASRALRNRSFHSIGVLMGGEDDFFLPQQTMGAISQVLTKHDYICTLVCTSGFDREHLLENRLLKERLIDALLIGYIHELPNHVVEEISKVGVPCVWLNRWLDRDSLAVDEADGSVQLVRHLVEGGYRKIMFVDYTAGGEGFVSPKQMQGFWSAAEEYSVEASVMANHRVPRERRYEVTREWLSRSNRPQAVVVSSVTAAQVIVQTAIQMGLRVPQDIAVCAFGDGNGGAVAIPSLTIAVRPEYDFGVAAAEMILRRAKNPQEPIASQSVKYSLAIGGSTVAEQSCIVKFESEFQGQSHAT